MIDSPVFLIGAERSGTTLMRLMLDSHPKISFAEEFEYAVSDIADDGTFPPMDEYGEMLRLNRIFSTSGFTFDRRKTYPQLVNGFLEERQRVKDADVVGATVHFGFTKALAVWPNARFIHMLRDPRDVARSCVGMGWAGNVWFGLDKWIEAEAEWEQLQQQVNADRRITVRFDELITDHEASLRRVCEFVDADYTDEMLSFADDTDYGIPDPNRARNWRDDMTDRDVRLIETRLGPLVAERGFEPSGLRPLPINGLGVKALGLHSRLRKLSLRVKVFGPRLVAKQLLARATGNEEQQKEIRLVLNELELDLREKSWSSDDSTVRSSK